MSTLKRVSRANFICHFIGIISITFVILHIIFYLKILTWLALSYENKATPACNENNSVDI